MCHPNPFSIKLGPSAPREPRLDIVLLGQLYLPCYKE